MTVPYNVTDEPMTPSRILIVEDEGIIALRFQHLLRNLGYEVTAMVATGEEALQSVVDDLPDLVLMDIHLAGALDGIETAVRIRARYDVPIVYLSAYVEQMDLDEVRHTQPYGLLSKPVRDREFAFTVERALYKHQMETRLRESEERYRLLFETAGIGIGYFTPAGKLLFFNKTAAQNMGGRPEDFEGQTIFDLFGEEAGAFYMDRIRAAVQSEEGQEYEDYVSLPSGDRWFLSNYTVVKDASDHVAGVQIISHNITERKQAERALKESRTSLQALINNTGDLISARDRAFRLTRYNQAFADFLPKVVDAEAAPGLRTIDYLPDEARHYWETIIAQVLGGQHYREVFNYEIDGAMRYYDLAFNPIKDEQGEVVGVAEFTHDVTEYKRIEQTLRRYAERLQILREIDVAILTAQSPEEIARVALQHVHNLIPYKIASISEIDLQAQQGRDLVILGEYGIDDATLVWHPIPSASLPVQALCAGEPYGVEDIDRLEHLEPPERVLKAQGIRSYVNVPLMDQGVLLGRLTLASDTPGFFQPDHVEILEDIAASLAVAMRQAHLLAKTQQNAEAQALLLRDVNHRVMNNLEMILGILTLEMDKLSPQGEPGDPRGQAVLLDMYHRIQGIITVHRLLSQTQTTTLDPVEVITRVIGASLSSSPIQDQVAVVVDTPEDVRYVSSKQAVALALITNELTTNSVKHAFGARSTGEINVQIKEVKDKDGLATLRLIYRDDGPGFPDAVIHSRQSNTGMWLLQTSATHTLGGSLTLHNDDGAVVTLQFPLTDAIL